MPRITVQGPVGPPISYRLDGERVRVGRAPGCDLVLHDNSVSRVHLEIRSVGDDWMVTDLESSNGTRVNDRKIFEATALAPGDRIAVGDGDTVLIFEKEVQGAVLEGALSESMIETSSSRGGADAEEPILVGESRVMQAVREFAETVAASEAPVLITGENGTGKELLARRIHWLSPRKDRPFVVLNCPAVPRDLFESELFGIEKGVATGVEPRKGILEYADGGTLLLDEIGDLDGSAQAKVLRFLQDRNIQRVGAREPITVDVRILAATNHDLERDIEQGAFRRDLYHRLNPLAVTLPRLRDRMEDLPALVTHFLSRPDGPRVAISEEAMTVLRSYSYPGNVRELDGAVLRARLFARSQPTILPEHLPDSLTASRPSEDGDLFGRLVSGTASFWDLVYEPFTNRELARDEVRALIERGYREAGGSYKKMCALFGVEDQKEYKKVLDWIRNSELGVPD